MSAEDSRRRSHVLLPALATAEATHNRPASPLRDSVNNPPYTFNPIHYQHRTHLDTVSAEEHVHQPVHHLHTTPPATYNPPLPAISLPPISAPHIPDANPHPFPPYHHQPQAYYHHHYHPVYREERPYPAHQSLQNHYRQYPETHSQLMNYDPQYRQPVPHHLSTGDRSNGRDRLSLSDPPQNQLASSHKAATTDLADPSHRLPPILAEVPQSPSQVQERRQPPSPSGGSNTASGSKVSTAQTNPRTSRGSAVVIACRQCRARKIRCDSTRPICHNCTRRSSNCEYDLVPKRRGPDKRPGTRQRTSRKKPPGEQESEPRKKKRHTNPSIPDESPTSPSSSGPPNLSIDLSSSTESLPRLVTESPLIHSPSPLTATSSSLPLYPAPLVQNSNPTNRSIDDNWQHPDNDTQERPNSYQSITLSSTTHLATNQRPPLPPQAPHYSRKDWWNEFLSGYSSKSSDAIETVVDDLTFLFSSTNYWLTCFNVPSFLRSVRDPLERENMQPSLILSALALATLMKSSEIGLGETGRNRALSLRDAAQTSLENSLSAHWIDPTLAQAALILALFEASAHPKHTPQRAASSLMILDSIIQNLALTCLDASDPETSVFPPRAVPAVTRQTPANGNWRCSCDKSPLVEFSPSGQACPGWDTTWTVEEIRKEESRRLCWSALALVAAHTADCATVRKKPLDLQLIKPSNYAILFPGEIICRSNRNDKSGTACPPKESVWALYSRSMLLWNSCSELLYEDMSDSEKAEFVLQAWMEADLIESALNAHTCTAEQASLFVGRDYLLNTRMTITQEFRRYLPLPTSPSGSSNLFFSRKKAEDWLRYQQGVAKKVKSTLHNFTEGHGKILAVRPFYVWWFMNQIAICMSLWTQDPSLSQALEICHEFLAPVDVLTYLWPCSVQRARYATLREKLTEASVAAGLEPPAPANYTLPTGPIA